MQEPARPVPLRLATAQEFAACRGSFEAAGYREDAVRARFGIRALSEFRTIRQGRAAAPVGDALDLVVRLFLDGEFVSRAQIASLLPAGAFDAMRAVGIVEPSPNDADLCAATVLLPPRLGMYLASDRATRADGAPVEKHDDVVFPATTAESERFVDLLPRGACDQFLDLGAGTGVAALDAARRGVRRAWATDVADRAAQFAEWNRRLNGIENATVVCGDLFEPVGGETFDRIAMHPPFVPSLERRLIYNDGGIDGQEITRRAVEGLSKHLRPGGRFYCLSLGADRDDEPFESAVRRWLGASNGEFDVAFFVHESVGRDQMSRDVALKSGGGAAADVRMRRALESLGVSGFPYGATVVQRHDSPRAPFTIRRQYGPRTTTAEIEWALRWETRLAQADAAEWLLDVRPAASPDLELCVVHRPQDGRLAPASYSLAAEYPFDMQADAIPWIADVAARADGKLTGRGILDAARASGAMPSSVTDVEFADVLGVLASGGILEIPGFAPPRGAARIAP